MSTAIQITFFCILYILLDRLGWVSGGEARWFEVGGGGDHVRIIRQVVFRSPVHALVKAIV
jgi:hypothetical protein